MQIIVAPISVRMGIVARVVSGFCSPPLAPILDINIKIGVRTIIKIVQPIKSFKGFSFVIDCRELETSASIAHNEQVLPMVGN